MEESLGSVFDRLNKQLDWMIEQMKAMEKPEQAAHNFSGEDSGLDSVGRLNIHLFYGENPDPWISRAENCFVLCRSLLEREKVEAAVACFAGEAWEWFQLVEYHQQIRTWGELKDRMLARFGVNQVLAGEDLSMSSQVCRAVGMVATRKENWKKLVASPLPNEKNLLRRNSPPSPEEKGLPRNVKEEQCRLQVSTSPSSSEEKKNGLGIEEIQGGSEQACEKKCQLQVSPSSSEVKEKCEGRIPKCLSQLKKEIRVGQEEQVTNDLLRGRRMESVGLISGLDYQLGFQVACFEETQVAKGFSGGNYLGSNPNPIWDPGINMTLNLEKRAEIQPIWVSSDPIPSGGPVQLRVPKGELASSFRSQTSFIYDTQLASNWYQSSHPSIQQSKPVLSGVPFSGLDLVDDGLSQEEGESRSVYVNNLSSPLRESSDLVSGLNWAKENNWDNGLQENGGIKLLQDTNKLAQKTNMYLYNSHGQAQSIMGLNKEKEPMYDYIPNFNFQPLPSATEDTATLGFDLIFNRSPLIGFNHNQSRFICFVTKDPPSLHQGEPANRKPTSAMKILTDSKIWLKMESGLCSQCNEKLQGKRL